jgi:pimeloyl-ACP methyl ester carboxylesterase
MQTRSGKFLASTGAIFVVGAFAAAVLLPGGMGAKAERAPEPEPLVIEKMGSYMVGGTVITAPGTFDPTKFPTPPDGQTFHGDHAYVQFHIPPNARKLPLVMWHGCLSTAWESTPDGREGYQSIFLRRGFAVYVLDQPRGQRAGRTTVGITVTAIPDSEARFSIFRLGIWPNFFPGSLFPQDPAALDNFFRQGSTPTGPANTTVFTDAVAALFAKIGPAVLITHSASGFLGWQTAFKSPNVKAIIAYEPSFVFPEGEVPPSLPVFDGTLVPSGSPVSLSDFLMLTQIPIEVVLGDNIPTTPSPIRGLDNWRLTLIYARQFVDAVNRHGGDASLLHLPDIGIYGNTHFAFTDLNNIQIADLLSKYLHDKGLDKREEKEKVDR